VVLVVALATTQLAVLELLHKVSMVAVDVQATHSTEVVVVVPVLTA
jgi:hypothetical protein